MINKDNYCVIMAGGIGSRFWPISSEDKPKQFIDVLSVGRTFIQQTYDRFSSIIAPENFVVVTNSRYRDMVLEQLPEIKPSQILCEPMRRNTAPCIAYAAYHIKAINPNATMVVTPSDHIILKQSEFEATINESIELASKENNLLTIGIRPTHPETGYGYIQVDEHYTGTTSKVKTFTEKPNLDLAKVFIESGEFFWNSGIFIWSVTSIVEAFKKYLPNMDSLFCSKSDIYNTDGEQEFIDSIYPACKNISIDYGIMEHASNVYMAIADFGWSDVGTWGSVYNINPKDYNGNIVAGSKVVVSNTTNSIVYVPEGKRAIVEGLDNHVVVLSGDDLLIFSKDREQEIKTFVEELKTK